MFENYFDNRCCPAGSATGNGVYEDPGVSTTLAEPRGVDFKSIGERCYKKCGKKTGPCEELCGADGMCCEYGKEENGCDGTMGKKSFDKPTCSKPTKLNLGEPCSEYCDKWNQCAFCGRDLMCIEGKCGTLPVVDAPTEPVAEFAGNMVHPTTGEVYIINFGENYCSTKPCKEGQGTCSGDESCEGDLRCLRFNILKDGCPSGYAGCESLPSDKKMYNVCVSYDTMNTAESQVAASALEEITPPRLRAPKPEAQDANVNEMSTIEAMEWGGLYAVIAMAIGMLLGIACMIALNRTCKRDFTNPELQANWVKLDKNPAADQI
jgi:hypothetical protein